MHKITSFSEKRTYQRFPIRIPASYYDSNLDRDIQAHTCDISVEGICIVTECTLSPGNYLDITLKIVDEGRKFLPKAKVVWVSMIKDDIYKVGIRLEGDKLDPIPIALKSLMNKQAN